MARFRISPATNSFSVNGEMFCAEADGSFDLPAGGAPRIADALAAHGFTLSPVEASEATAGDAEPPKGGKTKKD